MDIVRVYICFLETKIIIHYAIQICMSNTKDIIHWHWICWWRLCIMTFCGHCFHCEWQERWTFFTWRKYVWYIVYVIKVLHTNTFLLYQYVIYVKFFNYKMYDILYTSLNYYIPIHVVSTYMSYTWSYLITKWLYPYICYMYNDSKCVIMNSKNTTFGMKNKIGHLRWTFFKMPEANAFLNWMFFPPIFK